jgi:site-specific recombinase XerD
LGAIPLARQPQIQIEQFLQDLEKHLEYEKRYSKNNIHIILQRIRRLITYYKVELTPCQDDAIRIEEDLKAHNSRPDTIRHYLRALELMAEYQGVPLKVKKPKTVFRLPEILSLVECRAMMSSCSYKRDLAMINIFLYGGLRNKELINLDLQDVDIKTRILWVRDRGENIKNRHERKVVMTAECSRIVQEWIHTRPDAQTKALFITEHGKRITKDRVERIIRDIGKKAGITKRVYPHLLRHTCASMMLRSGVSLTDVALQLGHRSLSSTMVYLHSDVESLKENVDKKFRY